MKNHQGKIIGNIEARMGSSRLPGKMNLEILGKPVLGLMIDRVKQARLLDEVVVATSTNKNDDIIQDIAEGHGAKCFRGSEDDVLDRVLSSAFFHKAEHIVELWGDTPLIDPHVIDRAVEYYFQKGFDCLGTCLDKTYPWGISLLVFKTRVLAEAARITHDTVDRENVSTYIYGHPEKYSIGHLPCPDELKRPDLRLVLDERPDFELIKVVFEYFATRKPDFRTIDIIKFLDENPQVRNINKDVRQKKRGQYEV